MGSVGTGLDGIVITLHTIADVFRQFKGSGSLNCKTGFSVYSKYSNWGFYYEETHPTKKLVPLKKPGPFKEKVPKDFRLQVFFHESVSPKP
jgi:hypothetical protein